MGSVCSRGNTTSNNNSDSDASEEQETRRRKSKRHRHKSNGGGAGGDTNFIGVSDAAGGGMSSGNTNDNLNSSNSNMRASSSSTRGLKKGSGKRKKSKRTTSKSRQDVNGSSLISSPLPGVVNGTANPLEPGGSLNDLQYDEQQVYGLPKKKNTKSPKAARSPSSRNSKKSGGSGGAGSGGGSGSGGNGSSTVTQNNASLIQQGDGELQSNGVHQASTSNSGVFLQPVAVRNGQYMGSGSGKEDFNEPRSLSTSLDVPRRGTSESGESAGSNSSGSLKRRSAAGSEIAETVKLMKTTSSMMQEQREHSRSSQNQQQHQQHQPGAFSSATAMLANSNSNIDPQRAMSPEQALGMMLNARSGSMTHSNTTFSRSNSTFSSSTMSRVSNFTVGDTNTGNYSPPLAVLGGVAGATTPTSNSANERASASTKFLEQQKEQSSNAYENQIDATTPNQSPHVSLTHGNRAAAPVAPVPIVTTSSAVPAPLGIGATTTAKAQMSPLLAKTQSASLLSVNSSMNSSGFDGNSFLGSSLGTSGKMSSASSSGTKVQFARRMRGLSQVQGHPPCFTIPGAQRNELLYWFKGGVLFENPSNENGKGGGSGGGSNSNNNAATMIQHRILTVDQRRSLRRLELIDGTYSGKGQLFLNVLETNLRFRSLHSIPFFYDPNSAADDDARRNSTSPRQDSISGPGGGSGPRKTSAFGSTVVDDGFTSQRSLSCSSSMNSTTLQALASLRNDLKECSVSFLSTIEAKNWRVAQEMSAQLKDVCLGAGLIQLGCVFYQAELLAFDCSNLGAKMRRCANDADIDIIISEMRPVLIAMGDLSKNCGQRKTGHRLQDDPSGSGSDDGGGGLHSSRKRNPNTFSSSDEFEGSSIIASEQTPTKQSKESNGQGSTTTPPHSPTANPRHRHDEPTNTSAPQVTPQQHEGTVNPDGTVRTLGIRDMVAQQQSSNSQHVSSGATTSSSPSSSTTARPHQHSSSGSNPTTTMNSTSAPQQQQRSASSSPPPLLNKAQEQIMHSRIQNWKRLNETLNDLEVSTLYCARVAVHGIINKDNCWSTVAFH